MPVIHRRGWELPEHQATPEKLFLDRRQFVAAAAGAAAGALSPALAFAQRVSDLPDPSASLYPVKQNPKFVLDRPVTDEAINITYNNYYEFGSAKTISRAAQALKLRPWTVKIDGMVEKPQEIAIDDLVRKMPLEERLYRHRCVETRLAEDNGVDLVRIAACIPQDRQLLLVGRVALGLGLALRHRARWRRVPGRADDPADPVTSPIPR